MKNKLRGIFVRNTLLALAFACTVFVVSGWGQIVLDVDASEAARNLIHVKEKIEVKPGPFTLFYPKWIPGEHSPTGPLNNMINLFITAGGKPLAWQRDDVEMFAFRVDIPAGIESIEVAFDDAAEPGSTASSQLARIKWNRLLLYPRGVPDDKINVTASLKWPAGWQYATALHTIKESSDSASFKTVTLERFVDSPAIIGKNFKRVVLTDTQPIHEIDFTADTPEALEFTPELLQEWKNLIKQANLAFGAHHYDSYKFLVTLSDVGGDEGLEHHESSEDGTGLKALTEPEELADFGDLLSHEYTHSWNGKYRRPAGLATPDFDQPMHGDLLWVYEGLTEYLGNVFPARSGLWTPEIYRETLADVAAGMQYQTGRRWRPLVDTARAVQFTYAGSRNWRIQRRSADYYYEGLMIWLEADVLIRQRSGGKRSLDDFLHLFHGGETTGPMVRPYTFDDVVEALNKVQPYDWAGFLHDRVYNVRPEAPLGGIENGGWRLVYNATPNVRINGVEKLHSTTNATFSLGIIVDVNGTIEDIDPDLTAAKAGLSPGMTIVGVNGVEFSADVLQQAIANSSTSTLPITLQVDSGGTRLTVNLDYHGGTRYPHLVRDEGKPDVISDIIRPR